jgi:threonylcarbamoyladenosine tRNA methylthiotransferase MtaB
VRDSRRRARALQAAQPQAQLVATGCWATLAPAQAQAALPGLARVVPNERKDTLADEILSLPLAAAPAHPADTEPFERGLLAGARLRTRLFVKAQDGCDNHCAFCVTRLARGPGRSRPVAQVVAEINRAVSAGLKEIVLTGVHLGAYGHDWGDPDGLAHLVRAVLADTDLQRLRLSSLEPWDLRPEFFDLWQGAGRGRLCPHLHLPLQSGSAATLRRMARRATPPRFAALVRAARERIPDVAISTDVIAGFPGESEAEFAETLAFVEAQAFSDLHVFPYSPRAGTAAAKMRGQVPGRVAQARARRLREAGAALAQDYQRRFVGRARPVLWEATAAAGPQGFRWRGYTDNYLSVSRTSPDMLWNTVSVARLAQWTPEGFIGSDA